MRRLFEIAAVATLLFATGCTKDEASLIGSLGDFYELRHDEVRARLYPSELAIEYVRENNEVPVRITIVTDPMIVPGEYDLLEVGNITGRGDGVEIPRYRTGTLRLQEFDPNPETRIRGDFDATFETGKDVASLAGKFDTTLVVIDRVGGYSVDAEFIDVEQFRQPVTP